MNFKKRAAAIACATALIFSAGVVTPAAHAAGLTPRGGIGAGEVSIYAGKVTSYCQAHNLGNSCHGYGAGTVVPNVWSNNEVITAYHVVEGSLNDGSQIFVKIPGQPTAYKAYVQRADPAGDIAVMWIFTGDFYNPTPAPQFEEADIVTSNAPTNTDIAAVGNGNYGYSYIHNTPLDYNYGTVVNPNYNGPDNSVYDPWTRTWTTTVNTIKTTATTSPGDSGGPLYNLDKPGYWGYGQVDGFNDVGGPIGTSYAIQMQWAIWDMLNIRP